MKVYDNHEMVGTTSINVSINGLPSAPVVNISPTLRRQGSHWSSTRRAGRGPRG